MVIDLRCNWENCSLIDQNDLAKLSLYCYLYVDVNR